MNTMADTYTVQDVEMCAYEQFVGHAINGDAVPPPLSFPGWAEPDNCPDCIADPNMARYVHAGMRSVRHAIEAIRPFFSENTPDIILLKITMSAWVTQQQKMAELVAELESDK